MSIPIIRINEVALTVPNINKVVLVVSDKQLLIFTNGREAPFIFANQTEDEARSFFLHICELLKQTQATFPFIYFGNIAVRLDILSALVVENESLVFVIAKTNEERFIFDSNEVANKVFKDLMISLGITPATEAPTQIPEKQPDG